MLSDGIAGLETAGHDLCVVGSGPVGLALATDLARRGRRVLLVESGGEAAEPQSQALSMADIVAPERHDSMEIAVARRLGGTSNLWGARCLPYDPIDFEPRDWVDARWPIGFDAIVPFLPAAVAATRSGAPVYEEPIAGVRPADDRFRCDALERWANVQAAQAIHRDAIRGAPLLDVRTHATVTGIDFAENGRVEAVRLAHTLTGERARVPAQTLVLASGGIESTRLLLAAQAEAPERFGGAEGALGHYYMGHLVGEIADVVLASDAIDRAFEFRVDAHGSYVRRRIVAGDATQRAHRLLNTAFWPVVPPIADDRHGNAILSLVYLAMRVGPLGRMIVAEAIRRRHAPPGGRLLGHVANLATGLPSAAGFGVDFLRRRYARDTRLPGFFIRNRAHRYGFQYHAEQAPRRDSCVRLAGDADRLGVPRVRIDLRFSEQDADSIVRTHDLMEDWLAGSGIGRIEYRVPKDERGASVLAQASHGTHQVGLARMGFNRRSAVVDADLATFDAPNLYVASSAVLPTSGQANPTLTTVALALRLAERLARSTGGNQV